MKLEYSYKGTDIDVDSEDLGFATDHDPRSKEIYKFISAFDFNGLNDYFCWKDGGDGDNGEVLMSELDYYFKWKDKQDPYADDYETLEKLMGGK